MTPNDPEILDHFVSKSDIVIVNLYVDFVLNFIILKIYKQTRMKHGYTNDSKRTI